jgi:Mrp family chromosome partitioning ATPase
MEQALVRIADLQDESMEAGPERRAAIQEEVASLRASVAVYGEALGASSSTTAMTALLEEQSQLASRRASLLQTRDTVSVDAVLAPEVVAFASPARFAEPSGWDLGRSAGVGLILGLLGSSWWVVTRASRHSVVSDRGDPEGILGVPLLAEIPSFEAEELTTNLPVRDSPRSASAEAFRFGATSLEALLSESSARSILITSATLGQGKTTIATNLLFAISRSRQIVAVDADFGNQQLMALLMGTNGYGELGLTNVLTSESSLDEALIPITSSEGVAFHLLGRGTGLGVAAELLRQPRAKAVFRRITETNDLVIVDGPPILQVAYATTLATYVDGVVVVVPHRSLKQELAEVSDRLRLAGADVIGYVYNNAPLREAMTETGGSMRDVLGDLGQVVEPRRRSR